jgi:hypothetical protein
MDKFGLYKNSEFIHNICFYKNVSKFVFLIKGLIMLFKKNIVYKKNYKLHIFHKKSYKFF